MTKFRNNIALHCGVNAAIIADHLWEQLETQKEKEQALYRHEQYWCRCSHLMMTGEFPFLSLHMAKDAVKVLRKKNIIRKGCFNDNKFDHTNWYTFTDYGEKLMKEGAAA